VATTTKVSKKIQDEAKRVKDNILKGQKPSMKFPLRSLSNVKYTTSKGFLEMKGKKKERTLTVNTVKTFAQTLRMMALSKQLVDTDDIATKREAYYVSKNWDAARFKEQPESDAVMDDVEALFGMNREQLGFIPEEKGGDIAGQLIVIDKDRDTGKKLRIDCTKFGSGAYSIPISVEDLEFETKARFILVIETAGMFQRLVKHNYWKSANCILVSMGGVPTRACRRFIRRLSDEKKLPVYVFVDGDPYGFSNIYRTLKVGSGNAARHHAPGHHHLRPPHPPLERGRRQARQRRPQERPLHPPPPRLARRFVATHQDGRPRGAAGIGEARLELRDRHVSTGEAEEPESGLTVERHACA